MSRSSFGAFSFGKIDETYLAREEFRHEALVRAQRIANKLRRGEETYGITSHSKRHRSTWAAFRTPITDTSPARLAAERSSHARNRIRS